MQSNPCHRGLVPSPCKIDAILEKALGPLSSLTGEIKVFREGAGHQKGNGSLFHLAFCRYIFFWPCFGLVAFPCGLLIYCAY